MKRLSWLVALVLSVAASGMSQEAKPQATTLKVTTNLVVLDVTVTDRRGDPVTGLRKQDFKVFEDGTPQVLKSFDASIGSGTKTRRRAKTILVLDQLNDSPSEIAYARDCLRNYLVTQKGRTPTPAMLMAAGTDRLDLVHGYSTDSNELIKALDGYHDSFPFKFQRGFGDERFAETLSFLQQIAMAERGEKERKNLIWVGRGFPTVNLLQLSSREEQSLERVLHQTINMLLDARITVTKVDPTATTTVGTSDSFDLDDQDSDAFAFSDLGPDPYAEGVSFNALAIQTGGRLYYARNDLDAEIGQSIEQGKNFYTISYTPTNVGGNGSGLSYRHIRVQVTRPDLVVQAEHGYYLGAGTAPEPGKGELFLDLYEAASSRLTYTGLPVHFESLTPGKEPGTAICTISVEAHGLTYEPDQTGARHARAYIVVSSFSARNKMLMNLEAAVNTTAKVAEDPGVPGIRNVFKIIIPFTAEVKRLRIVVRDAPSGRTGSVEVDPKASAAK